MTMPRVSVLMPVFNGARFLEESVDSILSQTFRDFEFIIIDDGSWDGTSQLLAARQASDRRIKVITNEKNVGIVYALNRGFDVCSGDYILRMDADDIALRDRIEKQLAVMDNNGDISALGGALSYIDASGHELGVIRRCNPTRSLLTRTPLLHPTVMIRRSCMLQHGFRYQEKYRFAEDYFLWLQLSRVGRISAINDVVLKYRLNCHATKKKQLKNTILSTLKVKKDAIIVLKFKPVLSDVAAMFIELILLALPSSVVFFLFMRINFRKGVKINL